MTLKKELSEFEKDRDIKIRKEIEDLFTGPVNICFEDMDKFEEKEMMKERPNRKSTYEEYLLINYIPKPLKKMVGGV